MPDRALEVKDRFPRFSPTFSQKIARCCFDGGGVTLKPSCSASRALFEPSTWRGRGFITQRPHSATKIIGGNRAASTAIQPANAAARPALSSATSPKSAAHSSTASTFTSRFPLSPTKSCAANPSVRPPPKSEPAWNPPAKCSATAVSTTRKCRRRSCERFAPSMTPASGRSKWPCGA